MKTQLFLPLALIAMCCFSACSDTDTATTTNTDSLSTSSTVASTPSATTTHTLSENETYTDLKTGTTFRVKRDASGNWTRETGEPLEYYLSPVTHDTFYGPTGRWVNNALIYDPGSGYSIDEIRWNQMNANNGTEMQIDKIKETDEELKMKSADGEDKVKITDEETKIKTRDGMKIKSNEDETKIKQK